VVFGGRRDGIRVSGVPAVGPSSTSLGTDLASCTRYFAALPFLIQERLHRDEFPMARPNLSRDPEAFVAHRTANRLCPYGRRCWGVALAPYRVMTGPVETVHQ
jgi:hypothetical protein